MATGVAKSEGKGLRSLFSRDPLLALRDELEGLFSRFSAEMDGGWLSGQMMPSLDLSETDTTVEVRMDLPGIKPEDVDIQVTENTITIKGERKEEKEEKGNGRSFHRIERRSGSFLRTITLPCHVNQERVDAAYKDGVLTVTLPKSEAARTRKIKVKT
ncbi:MAG: Hsp20/alpha crystallin family protein [Planctomycetaceae bacterium]